MGKDRIKILVTGALGQLGQAIKELSDTYDALHFIFASREDLDITNKDALQAYVITHQPDAIINTAAYTAVDKAETNKETAFLVNEKAVRYMAAVCKQYNIKLVHVSTDYVFDGLNTIPYTELDKVNPQTVYGQSKLAGEQALQEVNLDTYFIVRTSWLYSKKGHNFYNTMLRFAKEGKQISVVNDQWGSPTNANELAKVLITIAIHGSFKDSGVYHYTGGGKCTWYAFAKAILEKYYPDNFRLTPVSTDQYPTPAKRPIYSVLDTSLVKNKFSVDVNNWEYYI